MKYKNWTLSDRKYPLFRGLKQTAVIDLQFFEGSSHVRCERRLDGGPARTPSKHFANAIVGNNLVVKQMSAPLARIFHQFAELWLRDFAPDSCSRPKP